MNLEELVEYVKRTLPTPRAISKIEKLKESNAIKIGWNNHTFIIHHNLSVVEIKDKRLFVTGNSLLVEGALRTHEINKTIIMNICDLLFEAEGMINNPLHQQKGLEKVNLSKKYLNSLLKKKR